MAQGRVGWLAMVACALGVFLQQLVGVSSQGPSWHPSRWESNTNTAQRRVAVDAHAHKVRLDTPIKVNTLMWWASYRAWGRARAIGRTNETSVLWASHLNYTASSSSARLTASERG
eukprot:229391-Prorocentrum_minimum.AAC.3